MNNYFESDSITDAFKQIEDYLKAKRDSKEQELAAIIQSYDFVVGSHDCQYRLSKILPKDAKIVYSPYVDSPTMVIAIKKFDIMDLFKDGK